MEPSPTRRRHAWGASLVALLAMSVPFLCRWLPRGFLLVIVAVALALLTASQPPPGETSSRAP